MTPPTGIRSLLTPLAVALLLQPAAAQTTISLNGGIAFASLSGDDVDEDFGTSDGFLGGVHLSFPLGDVLAIAPGLYWVQKGAEATVGNVENEIELSYLEVPVLGVFRVTGAERALGVSLFLGPSIAFELSCKESVEIGEDDATETDCDDDPDATERKSVDFGVVFGAGLSYPLTDRVSLALKRRAGPGPRLPRRLRRGERHQELDVLREPGRGVPAGRR